MKKDDLENMVFRLAQRVNKLEEALTILVYNPGSPHAACELAQKALKGD